jgi:hypothetical protein
MDEPEKERPISPSRLSKTPSWITLGFVLGALFVASLPREAAKFAPEKSAAPATAVKLERPKLTEIEAVFADWERYVVWDNNVTEVAMWDTEKKSFSIFYEVLRVRDSYYFRSIPRLTRPILTRGVPEQQSPLQFTETEASRREWIEHGQYEPRSRASDGR